MDGSTSLDNSNKLVAQIGRFVSVEAVQRHTLIEEAFNSLYEACKVNSPNLQGKLNEAGASIHALKELDGGDYNEKFKADMRTLTWKLNPPTEPGNQNLPFLNIVGVDDKGQVLVFDKTDGKREPLIADHALVEPDAPVDSSMHGALYLGDTHSGNEAWRDAIKPEHIQQGLQGDCYFLAPLQSLAERSPVSIKNMIQDNGVGPDGKRTFTVTFPGAKDKPQTVSEPTIYDVSAAAQDRSGLWVSVLEKAHRQLVGRTADTGGDPNRVMKLLTGNDGQNLPLNTSHIDANKLGALLASTVGHDDFLVTAGTDDPGRVVDSKGNLVELDSPHEYSVAGFDATNQTITLSNPINFNRVDGRLHLESGNVHTPDKLDALLNQTNPEIISQPNTGRLLTISINSFIRKFGSIEFGVFDHPNTTAIAKQREP